MALGLRIFLVIIELAFGTLLVWWVIDDYMMKMGAAMRQIQWDAMMRERVSQEDGDNGRT